MQYNQARQTNPDKLMVKYTGDNNKYTRYAYVKFNLNDLKAELEQRGLEIKSAELCYRAQSSAAGYARDLYLKEAAEKMMQQSQMSHCRPPISPSHNL